MALEIDMQLTGITGIAKGYIAFHSKVPSECRKLHFLTVYCEYPIPHPPPLPWTTPLAKQFSKSTIPSFHPLPPPLSPSPTLPREIKCYSLVQGPYDLDLLLFIKHRNLVSWGKAYRLYWPRWLDRSRILWQQLSSPLAMFPLLITCSETKTETNQLIIYVATLAQTEFKEKHSKIQRLDSPHCQKPGNVSMI